MSNVRALVGKKLSLKTLCGLISSLLFLWHIVFNVLVIFDQWSSQEQSCKNNSCWDHNCVSIAIRENRKQSSLKEEWLAAIHSLLEHCWLQFILNWQIAIHSVLKTIYQAQVHQEWDESTLGKCLYSKHSSLKARFLIREISRLEFPGSQIKVKTPISIFKSIHIFLAGLNPELKSFFSKFSFIPAYELFKWDCPGYVYLATILGKAFDFQVRIFGCEISS